MNLETNLTEEDYSKLLKESKVNEPSDMPIRIEINNQTLYGHIYAITSYKGKSLNTNKNAIYTSMKHLTIEFDLLNYDIFKSFMEYDHYISIDDRRYYVGYYCEKETDKKENYHILLVAYDCITEIEVNK